MGDLLNATGLRTAGFRTPGGDAWFSDVGTLSSLTFHNTYTILSLYRSHLMRATLGPALAVLLSALDSARALAPTVAWVR